jgi:hypothetical protein
MILFLSRFIQEKLFTLTIALALLWSPDLTLIQIFFAMTLVEIVSFDAELNSTSNSTAFRLNSDSIANPAGEYFAKNSGIIGISE